MEMDDGVETLYAWVRQTRAPLMTALEALGPARYTAPQATLAGDSVRDRHIHMAQCYLHWVARVGLERDLPGFDAAAVQRPADAAPAFAQADEAVASLCRRYAGRLDERFARTVAQGRRQFTARWLLSHPITHEFHHKGQIVVVLRMFGIDPGDTDLVWPFASAQD
jgi:uncharacterized damage-inducible protein DinB